MADLELALLAAEHVGCLTPRTPHLQGPDPDDTPEPCGSCPLCLVVGQRDEARAEVVRLTDGIREHSCGISKGCYCTWDEDGNPIGEHGPNCFQPFESERRLKALLDVAGDDTEGGT